MTHRIVQTENYQYVIAPDVDLPIAQRAWAVVITRLIDELTDDEPAGWMGLECSNRNFTTRIGTGGFAGVAAIPLKAMPLHAFMPYPMTLSVTADEYVADSKDITIAADVLFPASFTPVNLGDWPFHRKPVSIYGSVNLAAATGPAPVPGAAISITSLWRKVGLPPAALAPLSLSGVLAAARPAASTVQVYSMTPTGTTYQLVKEAGPGSTSALFSNTLGLAVGNVVGFDLGDPDLEEYATVLSISGSVNPAQPATVQFTFPLQFLHFSLAQISQVTPAPTGAVNNVAVDAIAGDRVLLLNSPIAGIATGDVVAINGGTATTEYQSAAVFSVASDALGNYRLPLLSRVAQLELTANDGVHAPLPQLVLPKYGNPDFRVDFLLN